MTTKIVFASDIHGQFFQIPKCDILVLSGDICPNFNNHPDYEAVLQKNFLERDFANWISGQNMVICTYGNHDYVGERFHNGINLPNCEFLLDQTIVYNDLVFYGSPWQRRFYDWAFNLDEPRLDDAYELIPSNVDVLITHGPPFGLGDLTPSKENVGSKKLLQKIKDYRPKVSVFGHIHSGYGSYYCGNTIVLNASVVDEKYTMINPLFVVNFDNNKNVISVETEHIFRHY